jgi:hypothetical protein
MIDCFMDRDGSPPAGALKLKGGYATGALWAYPVNTFPPRCCACRQERLSQDPWARLWIPANQLYSVMVLDSNGNRVARLGRYGNVDDEGLRFAWPKAVAASDTAVYVMDYGNRRVLKAALSYAAEETVPLP